MEESRRFKVGSRVVIGLGRAYGIDGRGWEYDSFVCI